VDGRSLVTGATEDKKWNVVVQRGIKGRVHLRVIVGMRCGKITAFRGERAVLREKEKKKVIPRVGVEEKSHTGSGMFQEI